MRPWAMTLKPLAGVRVVVKVASIWRAAIGLLVLIACHFACAQNFKASSRSRAGCGVSMPDFPNRVLRNVRWSGECGGGTVFARGVLLFTYQSQTIAQWGYWVDGRPSGLHVRLTQGNMPLSLVRYGAPSTSPRIRTFPAVQPFEGKVVADEFSTVREGESLRADEIQAEVTLWSRRPDISPLEVFNSAPAGLTPEERGPPPCCGPNR